MAVIQDAEVVRAEIQRVLLSKTFETSETHRRLLAYLSEKSLAGEADHLKEYTIGLEAFRKPPHYDPQGPAGPAAISTVSTTSGAGGSIGEHDVVGGILAETVGAVVQPE